MNLVERNNRFLKAGRRLGDIYLCHLQANIVHTGQQNINRPTVCLHTYPLPFYLWADKYQLVKHLLLLQSSKFLRNAGRRN